MKTFRFNRSAPLVALACIATGIATGTPIPILDSWSVVSFSEASCSGFGTGWSAASSFSCGSISPLTGTTHNVHVKSGPCTVAVWKADAESCPAADVVQTFIPGTNDCFSFSGGIGSFEVTC